MTNRKYTKLSDFYWYYLTEHQNTTCRKLHFIGTLLLFVILGISIFLNNLKLLFLLPLVGYGFAWIGHAFFERNKPATFQYPIFSLLSDFIMFYDILTGQIDRKLKLAQEKIKE